MILTLDSMTFSKYGIVYTNTEYRLMKEERGGGIRVESFHEASPVFYAEEDLWLDLAEYPTILSLIDAPGKIKDHSIISFLLDKPVLIKRNRRFQIAPLGEESSVEFFPAEAELRQDTSAPSNVLPRYGNLTVSDIQTAFYQEKELGFHFKGEHHPAWELTYVDIGEMHSLVDGVDTLLKQGDLAFYGPGQHHIQYADDNVAVNYYTIVFNMDLPQPGFLLGQSFSVPREITPLLGNILAESREDRPYSMELMKCYLTQFLIGVIRYLDGQKPNGNETFLKSNMETNVVQCACHYVMENVFAQISVAEIAKHVNLSAPYLSVLFRRKKGIKIIDYITLVKLNKSKELIRSGEYSITQISEMLGYSSIHYFSRQFKQKYGITPTQYAKHADER